MLKVWLARAKGLLDRAKDMVVCSPVARNPAVVVVWRTVLGLMQGGATDQAATVGYYGILSLFPLLIGLLALSGVFLGAPDMQERFLELATENFPGSREFVERNVDQIVRFRGALGVGAVLGLLWTGSAVFGAISRAINRVWRVQDMRPFYVAKPRQILMALTAGVLLLVSAVAASVISILSETDAGAPVQEFLEQLGAGWVLLRLAPWLVTLLVFLLLYRFVPNCDAQWRYIWPGAVLAAVLFEAGKTLFVWYLQNFAIYSQIYGSLASAVVLMVWVYISALILLAGAQVGAEYQRLRRPDTLAGQGPTGAAA